MATKLDVLKQIFGTTGRFLFLGNKAFRNVSEKIVAEVFFYTGSHSGKFVGLTVSIRNKDTGEVASNQFSFEQYLRSTAKCSPTSNDVTMHVWDSGSCDWYIVVPTTTEPIVDAINEYIDLYDSTFGK